MKHIDSHHHKVNQALFGSSAYTVFPNTSSVSHSFPRVLNHRDTVVSYKHFEQRNFIAREISTASFPLVLLQQLAPDLQAPTHAILRLVDQRHKSDKWS